MDSNLEINQRNDAPGRLFVVATPIGNLGDMTPRAIKTLTEVDLIAAEDTRHSRPLLNHFGISTALTPVHDHNEREQTPILVERMIAGANIALISDAGTPLVSDPGYRLVDAARKAGIEVLTVPGASALIAGLSVAGLPTDAFGFYGFLPAKSQARVSKLSDLSNLPHTWVAYESSHRILHTVRDMSTVLNDDRQIVLLRELTKRFEQSYRGNATELLAWLEADSNRRKGEFVLVVAGLVEKNDYEGLNPEAKHILEVLLTELPVKQAASLAAKLSSENKNTLYKYAVAQKNNK